MTAPDNRAPECWSCRAGHPPTADQVRRAQTLIDCGTDAHGWAHVLEQAERITLEAAAGVCENVNVACDYERHNGDPGAAAMAAVLEYRDAIRALAAEPTP